MAIKVAMCVLLFIVRSLMISHLGTNPVSGGRPPSDRSTVNVEIIMMGDLLHVRERDEIVWLEWRLKEMNRVSVRRI